MKKGIVFGSLLLLTLACSHKLPFTVPAGLEGEMKQNCIANFYAGEQLFKVHCDKCHGIFSKGVKNASKFTEKEIDNYALRLTMFKTEQHFFAKNLSYAELEQILLFLKIRKR